MHEGRERGIILSFAKNLGRMSVGQRLGHLDTNLGKKGNLLSDWKKGARGGITLGEK